MAGDFESSSLPGGVRLHILPEDKFKTVTVQVFIHRPLRTETVTATALLPLVLQRGSMAYPSRRLIARRLEELYGAEFGAQVIKMGEVQSLVFTLALPNERFLPGGDTFLADGLSVLRSIMLEPLVDGGAFRDEFVDGEKEILGRKIRSLINDKVQYAVVRCFEETCRGEDFALYKYGRVEDLPDITPAGLYEDYQRAWATAPVDIFFVGRMDRDSVRQAAAGSFSLQRAEIPGLDVPPVDQVVDTVREVEEVLPVQQAKLSLGFRTNISPRDPRFYGLLLYNGILGGFPHSKLFRNVREKASLAYYAFSRLEITKGLMVISSGIEKENRDRAQEIILQQVEAMKQGDFTAEELDFTRLALANRIRSAADDPQAMVALHMERMLNGRRESTKEILERIAGVNREQIVEAAGAVQLQTVYSLRPEEVQG